MRAEYDPSADAAYVYLVEVDQGGVARTYTCDVNEVGGMINLDFDSQGRLLGVEILEASRLLTRDFLDIAKKVGW